MTVSFAPVEPHRAYVPCRCGTPYHHICFDVDPDMPDEIDISFVSTRNGSFWRRVKWALKHVFGREDLVFADAIVSKKRLVEVMKGLQQ